MKTKLIEQIELLKLKFIRINKLEWYQFEANTSKYVRVTGDRATFIETLYQKESKTDYEADKYA
jgi:hypothetical protein